MGRLRRVHLATPTQQIHATVVLSLLRNREVDFLRSGCRDVDFCLVSDAFNTNFSLQQGVPL
jgi:hypothetical protein